MKLKPIFLAGVVAATAAGVLNASEQPATENVSFVSIRTPELPKEVARRIEQTEGADRAEKCVAYIEAAVRQKPAAAAAVVGAASRVAPEFAARFAAAAVKIERPFAAGIARAAVAAAPDHAAEIVAAIVKVEPASYAQIAYDVAYPVPEKDGEIARSVVSALPNLKSFVRENPAVVDLVASTSAVDKAARKLGLKTAEFLVADLTPAQAARALPSPEMASLPRRVEVAAAGSTSPAAQPKPAIATFTPAVNAPLAARIIVTPSTGREYYRPTNRGPLP
jgi:hypothetical protein